jgi:hypothetical protein
MDPAADPAVVEIQDAIKTADYFLKVHLHHFTTIKSHKEVTKQ